MPAKKTFSSIRVRGLAQFDQMLQKGSKPVPAFREYIARVTDLGGGELTITVVVNTLGGAIVWEYQAIGQFQLNLVGGFVEGKTVAWFAGTNNARCQVADITTDWMSIETHAAGGALQDGVMVGTFIIIHVY